MGQLKASEVDRYISRPNGDIRTFLIYGPDAGLVSERADILAQKTGVDLKDAFSFIRLDSDEAAADVSRVADEAYTVSMFGGARLIRISGTTRRDLSKSFGSVLKDPPPDTWIIVEAGDLKKTSGLRKQFEKSKSALALPCYPDSDAALNQLITQEIEDKCFAIDTETRSFLRGRLGADRRASRNELQKLALYATGNSSVSLEDVKTIVGDASQTVVDDLIDCVATGNVAELQGYFNEVITAGTVPDQLLIFALRHFQTLHQARALVEGQRQSPVSVIGGMRPPIHFSRKDKVTKALSIWKLNRLTKAMERLDAASFQCRKSTDLAASLASTTLLAISLEAKAAAAAAH